MQYGTGLMAILSGPFPGQPIDDGVRTDDGTDGVRATLFCRTATPTCSVGDSSVELGVIGLGRMGRIVVDRVLEAGHEVVVFDIDEESVADAADAGARPASSIADLAGKLGSEKRIWLMVPAGDPVDAALDALARHSTAMTSWSTAAIRTSRTRSGAPSRPTRPTSTVGPLAVPPVQISASR